jgi:hypothetical protein
MTSTSRTRRIGCLQVLALACTLGAASSAFAATPQRVFKTSEEAASALVQAVKAHDRKTVLAIVGQSAGEWVSSGDPTADRAANERFIQRYEEKHTIAAEGDKKATLVVGNDEWPFAFPLVKAAAGWRFDTEAGKQELLARRIGANELAVMNTLLNIVDAQREYASADRDGSGLRQYAAKFASSTGKKDGLYWPTAAGEPESPLGPLAARAAAEGYKKGSGPQPYHGYHFKILTRQGPSAKGGALDYVARGKMIGGFAAIAYPARYGNSGVMTFIVNHDGVVYERDLGPDTAKRAAAIASFDPGQGWTPAKPE